MTTAKKTKAAKKVVATVSFPVLNTTPELQDLIPSSFAFLLDAHDPNRPIADYLQAASFGAQQKAIGEAVQFTTALHLIKTGTDEGKTTADFAALYEAVQLHQANKGGIQPTVDILCSLNKIGKKSQEAFTLAIDAIGSAGANGLIVGMSDLRQFARICGNLPQIRNGEATANGIVHLAHMVKCEVLAQMELQQDEDKQESYTDLYAPCATAIRSGDTEIGGTTVSTILRLADKFATVDLPKTVEALTVLKKEKKKARRETTTGKKKGPDENTKNDAAGLVDMAVKLWAADKKKVSTLLHWIAGIIEAGEIDDLMVEAKDIYNAIGKDTPKE